MDPALQSAALDVDDRAPVRDGATTGGHRAYAQEETLDLDTIAWGHGLVLPTTYDPYLVALSVVVASIAAYTALTLAERVTVAQGRLRLLWLLGGATAMGSGIWSMHFTGMLAFSLPIPVSYDVPLVALSLLVAIAASGSALFIVSRRAMGGRAWLVGGR